MFGNRIGIRTEPAVTGTTEEQKEVPPLFGCKRGGQGVRRNKRASSQKSKEEGEGVVDDVKGKKRAGPKAGNESTDLTICDHW